MSYNISNSGKTISVTPFAHYRFDNLNTNLIGTTISAIDDQSGNNRHAITTEAGEPMVASAGWSTLPNDMTSLRFDGRSRTNLVHEIVEADRPSQMTSGVTIVAVFLPEKVTYGQPAYNQYGILAAFEGGYYQNNNTYTGIETNSARTTSRSYVPGRFPRGGSPIDLYMQVPGPMGYVFERNAFGETTENGEYGQPGSFVQSGQVQDWNLVHEKTDSTLMFPRTPGETYRDYELYNRTALERSYSEIIIGSPRGTRHSSYNSTRGRLFEVLMFDTNLNLNDRTAIAQYIQDRYDINNTARVDDNCLRLPAGEEINIRNLGESTNTPIERNRFVGDSTSVDLWFRVNGLRNNAPGIRYRNNIKDYSSLGTKWGTFFTETTSKDQVANTHNHRAKISGYLARGDNMNFYVANKNTGNQGHLANNRWYHVKWVLTDYKEENYTYNLSLFINGTRVSDMAGSSYRYWAPVQTIMGIGPSLGMPGDIRPGVNYELPSMKYTTSTKRPDQSGLWSDDPTQCPNEYVLDIAGYHVTVNEFESSEDVDSVVTSNEQWQTIYDDVHLSAGSVDDHLYKPHEKPSDVADSTSTEPSKDIQELGAWAYIKAMYNPRPPLTVLGVTQWGSTNSLWNGSLTLTSRRISGDLSWLTYTTANKSFKHTHLQLNSNLINSVDGLQYLYGTPGPGGDTPTSVNHHLYMDYNNITSLAPLTNSTFTQYGRFQDCRVSYNRLENLDGLENSNEYFHYRTLDYKNNRITNIDALASTAWRRTGGFDLSYNKIDFTPGVYPFEHWSGMSSNSVTLNYNHITDLRYASASALNYLSFTGQYTGQDTPIDGLNELWVPNCYYLLGDSNVYKTTTLSDVDIVNRFNRVTDLHFANTNILDMSSIALLTQEARDNAPDKVSTPYTGGVYGAAEDYTYGDGFSAKDLAMFNTIDFSWRTSNYGKEYPNEYLAKTNKFGGTYMYNNRTFPYEQQTETPTYRSTSLERTNGLTSRYNQGHRIYSNRELSLTHAPLHDLRIFKYAFHGIRAWYSPHPNHHFADFSYSDMPSGPNTTGALKDWSKIQKVILDVNRLSNLDDWFVDSGFHDSPEADDRSFWRGRRSYEYLYLQYNNITDLSFMLKKNFSGVKYLYLNYNPITYEEVDRIADDLITLKQNGDINLIQVDMFYTTWDFEYHGYSHSYWDNKAYYQSRTSGGSHGAGPGGWYMYPLSGAGENSALYSKKSRALGFQGWKYEDGYTPEALLRKRLLEAGINFRFNRNTSEWKNGLGYGTTWPTGDADWNNYHSYYSNHYRWGHLNTAGRLVMTQTDTTENASNELTIAIENSVDMYTGDQLILYGSGNAFKTLPMASNNNYPVGGSLGAVFGGSGVWNKTDGTLTMTVAPGQMMTHLQLYELKWTITNPSYADDITDGHSSHSDNKFGSGRSVYVMATDRHGTDRTDNQTYYTAAFGPTTQ